MESEELNDGVTTSTRRNLFTGIRKMKVNHKISINQRRRIRIEVSNMSIQIFTLVVLIKTLKILAQLSY